MCATRKHFIRAWIGCIAIAGSAAWGQAPATPKDVSPPPPAQVPGAQVPRTDLAGLTSQMAEQVGRLGKDIASGLNPTPLQQELGQDTAELSQALQEFQKGLAGRPDPLRLRRSFSGVDGSWHHLRERLVQPGVSTFAMNRALQTIDELDAKWHKALGYAVPPATYFGQGPAPSGLADLKRLGRSLADRAAYLAGVVQADLPAGMPNRSVLVQRAVDLESAAAIFLQATQASDDHNFLQNGFSAVAVVADPFERELAATALPARVGKAWEAFAVVELAIRQNLGLPVPPPALPNAVVAGGKDRVRALADQLSGQVGAFLEGFAPTASAVPEGAFFLADTQRLRAAADDFREDAARGLTLTQLAYEFRDIDASWQRLARRVIRVARGRNGPNIQRALAIGDTCAEIHQLLAIPGYPPDLRSPALPPEASIGDGLGDERQPPRE
jgi:hypothetical protein